MRSSPSWLKQLDRVARGVVDQDLGSSGARSDIVAEPQPGRAKALDFRRDVVHNELDPVPAARTRYAGIGHPAELVGPLSRSRKSPRVTSANAGGAFESSLKPKCVV